ncbi:hypothetical protein [Cerasicoccus fimbriatus]|uniref:hypothetical protein n=1 Tax=Cerasicoccus fimbriatus TaxID=3014554 RepID=UPI0022B4E733|nr:hypothetical protein [Cerasicoccus sp. TK19100]
MAGLMALLLAGGVGSLVADDSAQEMAELRAMLKAQQQMIDELSQEVKSLRGELGSVREGYVAVEPPTNPSVEVAANEQLPPPEPPPVDPDLSFTHHDWQFEVYGFVKLDMAYDTHGVFNGDFVRYVYPEGPSSDSQLSFTARETRLGLKINGPQWDGWRTGARVETDFYGDYSSSTPTLRMRLAYAEMEKGPWLFRAGQDWDALTVALPRTVNCGAFAYQGALWSRRPLLKAQWQDAVGPGKLRVTSAIAGAISGDIDGGGTPDGKDSGVPNTELTIAYELDLAKDWTLTTAVGGMYGQEAFDNASGGETDYDTYVGMFTGVLNWKDRAKLLGAIWSGTDLGSFNGGVGQTVNLAKSTSVDAWGGWIQLQTFPWEDINWNIGAGIDNPRDADLSPGMRKFNTTATTSIFYKLTPYLTIAGEYSFLTTGYVGLPTADSQRFQGSVIVEF